MREGTSTIQFHLQKSRRERSTETARRTAVAKKLGGGGDMRSECFTAFGVMRNYFLARK